MKKKATLLLALALALCLAGCNSFTKEKPAPEGDSGTESAAVFSGGSGTEDDPFLITTADGDVYCKGRLRTTPKYNMAAGHL